MSETDLGPLPTSKMELAVTIINGSSIYVNSPLLASRFQHLSSITHIIVILKNLQH